jgi:hypothetical protein
MVPGVSYPLVKRFMDIINYLLQYSNVPIVNHLHNWFSPSGVKQSESKITVQNGNSKY